MKAVEREVTKKEIAYYEAVDGKRFYGENAKDECSAYEKTAEGVMAARYHECLLKRTNEYNLYQFGDSDHDVDIVKIDTENDLKAINMYLKYTIDKGYNGPLPEKELLKKETVGTIQLIAWNYDHDWMKVLGTIDDMIKYARESYEEALSQE